MNEPVGEGGDGDGGAAAAGPALEGRTILVLEDESLIMLDATLALEELGARVLPSGTSDGALHVLDTRRVDAAVLDVTLADGSTCEPVARRLAALGVPYLLHSGDAARHAGLLRRLGAPLVSKPFPSHRLVRRVARLLADA